MEGEIFVANLEANIQLLLKAMKESSDSFTVERKKEIEDIVKALADSKVEQISLEKLEGSLEKILEKLSEEVLEEDTVTPKIVEAIEAVKTCIDGLTLPEVDLTEVESKLDSIASAFSSFKFPELVLPDVYPLPQEQLEQIKYKADIELHDKIDLVNKLLKEISERPVSSGGGGSDVVGLKSIDAQGKQFQINPATDETLKKIVGFDVNSNVVTSIITVGAVKTIAETDGVKTNTTTVDKTNPLDIQITNVWS